MGRNLLGFLAACGLLALAASSAWVFHSSSFQKGLLVGILSTAAAAMSIIAFLAAGGIYPYVGSLGEDLTREELKRATKQGWTWGWVDNLETTDGDIDHALVAPRGLVALETKFHLSDKRDLKRLQSDARQAQRGADKLRSIVRSVHVKHAVEVLPIVVVWGPMQADLKGSREIDGVTIVPGADLREFLSTLKSGLVSEDNGEQLLESLRGFRDRVQPGLSRRVDS